MSGDRQELDMPEIPDLDDFKLPPKPEKPHKVPGPANDADTGTSGRDMDEEKKAVDKAALFPSREAPDDDQLNIKGPKKTLNRFRALRKSERYKYSELLDLLMDAYEEKQNQG